MSTTWIVDHLTNIRSMFPDSTPNKKDQIGLASPPPTHSHVPLSPLLPPCFLQSEGGGIEQDGQQFQSEASLHAAGRGRERERGRPTDRPTDSRQVKEWSHARPLAARPLLRRSRSGPPVVASRRPRIEAAGGRFSASLVATNQT